MGRERQWFYFTRSQSSYVRLAGYYPSDLDWTVATLHRRQAELRRLRLVLEGQGAFPAILVGCTPLPIIDSSLMAQVPGRSQIVLVPVRVGYVKGDHFVDSSIKSYCLPAPLVCYARVDEVPDQTHVALVSGRFLFDDTLEKGPPRLTGYSLAFYYFGAEYRQYVLGTNKPRMAYRPRNFDHCFVKRSYPELAAVEERLRRFVTDALAKFYKVHGGGLTVVLLDLDADNGDVILALKTSPCPRRGQIDIEDFEHDAWAVLEPRQVVGECRFLREADLGRVAKAALERLIAEGAFARFTRTQSVRIGYAHHDRPIKWVQ